MAAPLGVVNRTTETRWWLCPGELPRCVFVMGRSFLRAAPRAVPNPRQSERANSSTGSFLQVADVERWISCTSLLQVSHELPAFLELTCEMSVLKNLTKRTRDDVVKPTNSINTTGAIDEKVKAAGIKRLPVLISLCGLPADTGPLLRNVKLIQNQ